MTPLIKMPELQFGNLKARIPIIQGGMGVGVSLSGLAAAVSNAGGIGVISSTGLGMLHPRPDMRHHDASEAALRYEIKRARKHSKGLLGINILQAMTNFDGIIKTVLDEKINFVFIGAGLPLKKPANLSLGYLKKIKSKIIPIVSSARAAGIILRSWAKKFNTIPDGFVIEGPLAGGHLGFKNNEIKNNRISLQQILRETLPVIRAYEADFKSKIPLIAAGGIFSGSDIFKMLKLGADGVQLGTRFVATEECDASMEFKQKYVECSKNDISIIASPLGLPGRAIRNPFLRSVEKGDKKPDNCPYKCLQSCDIRKAPYCIAKALINAQKGDLKNGFAFCGQNAYRIKRIVPVKQLMKELEAEFVLNALSYKMEPEPV